MVFPPLLLRYSQHTALYKLKAYSIIIRLTNIWLINNNEHPGSTYCIPVSALHAFSKQLLPFSAIPVPLPATNHHPDVFPVCPCLCRWNFSLSSSMHVCSFVFLSATFLQIRMLHTFPWPCVSAIYPRCSLCLYPRSWLCNNPEKAATGSYPVHACPEGAGIVPSSPSPQNPLL